MTRTARENFGGKKAATAGTRTPTTTGERRLPVKHDRLRRASATSADAFAASSRKTKQSSQRGGLSTEPAKGDDAELYVSDKRSNPPLHSVQETSADSSPRVSSAAGEDFDEDWFLKEDVVPFDAAIPHIDPDHLEAVLRRAAAPSVDDMYEQVFKDVMANVNYDRHDSQEESSPSTTEYHTPDPPTRDRWSEEQTARHAGHQGEQEEQMDVDPDEALQRRVDVFVLNHSHHEFWMSMPEDILTLGFEQGRQGTRARGMAWLQSSVIDMHLLHRWYRTPNPSVRYLDSALSMSYYYKPQSTMSDPLDAEEVRRFREKYLLPVTGPAPMVPLIYLILIHNNHYIAIIQDTENARIHVVGRSSGATGNPKAFWESEAVKGYKVMSLICLLHGWDCPPRREVQVSEMRPPQNGYDCGIVVIHTALSLFENGLLCGENGRLIISPATCGHIRRLEVARDVLLATELLASQHEAFRQRPPQGWNDGNEPDPSFPARLRQAAQTAVSDIENAQSDCRECFRSRALEEDEAERRAREEEGARPPSREQTPADDGEDITEPRGSDHQLRAQQRRTQPHPTLGGFGTQAGPAPARRVRQRGGEDTMPMYNVYTYAPSKGSFVNFAPKPRRQNIDVVVESGKLASRIGNIQKKALPPPMPIDSFDEPRAVLRSLAPDPADTKPVWLSNHVVRFPRPTPAVEVPLPGNLVSGALYLRPSYDFDEYFSGPTRDDNKAAEDPVFNLTNNEYTRYQDRAYATRWRDRGYRLHTSFAHMCYLTPPVRLSEHLLRPGLSEDYDFKSMYGRDATQVSLTRSADPLLRITTYMDVKVLGLGEMLRLVGDDLDQVSHDLFIRGVIKEDGIEKRVIVDVERDEEVNAAVEAVVDVDSLVWTTRTPRTKGPVEILLAPIASRKSQIPKNNHCYVNVCEPPSDVERAAGEPLVENRVTPSTIPHTRFAKVGPCDIVICFPRMSHRHEKTKFKETIVPPTVLMWFWDGVVLPAVRQAVVRTKRPYLDFSAQGHMDKATGGGEGGTGALFNGASRALTASEFERVCTHMREFMKQKHNDDRLGRFGSFFFVTQAKGIKLTTHTRLDAHVDLWDGLREQYPQLDWEYMQDRRYGELFVDVGITYHPMQEEEEAGMVGLWRLEALEASYGASGLTTGDTHHVASLARYGAKAAEMPPERTRRSHVGFRQSYNLAYEPMRPKDNQPRHSKDRDAYETNRKWHRANERHRSGWREASWKSWGVREEHRMTGLAVSEFLERAHTLSQEYLESRPMLMLKSETWFGFLSRRLRELEACQLALRRTLPPNYGLITGILMHMIRAITSTPREVPSHVVGSLKSLKAGGIMLEQGLLFLPELNVYDVRNALPGIRSSDGLDVADSLGLPQRRRPERPVAARQLPSGDYPIGRNPLWNDVLYAVQNHPATFMKAPIYRPIWAANAFAAEIFIEFTFQMFLVLLERWRRRHFDYPTGLKQAMDMWSPESLQDTLSHASNSGHRGAPGAPANTFRQHMRIYFPVKETDMKDRVWSRFKGDPSTSPGYVAQYFAHLEADGETEEGAEARARLDDTLMEIFEHLQCLPWNASAQPWTRSKDASASIVVICNPRYYKIDSIGVGGQRQRPLEAMWVDKTDFVEQLRRAHRDAGTAWHVENVTGPERRAAEQSEEGRERREAAAEQRQQQMEAAMAAREANKKKQAEKQAEKRKKQKRSNKAKRARKPPQRRQPPKEAADEEEESEGRTDEESAQGDPLEGRTTELSPKPAGSPRSLGDDEEDGGDGGEEGGDGGEEGGDGGEEGGDGGERYAVEPSSDEEDPLDDEEQESDTDGEYWKAGVGGQRESDEDEEGQAEYQEPEPASDIEE